VTRLDPRTLLALLLLSIAGVLVTRRPAVLAVECILLVSAVGLQKTDRSLARMFKLTGTMLAVVFVIGVIFFDLLTAAALVLRLFNLLALSFVFFQNLEANEMAGALQKLKVPFGFTFILTTGMRYVPLIGRKIAAIRDAQQARGIDLRLRLKNLPNLAALLVPLIVQSFILADDLALAMESRGFARKNRSARRDYHIRPWEYLLMAGAIVILGLLIWMEQF
jgi:energy-coupling factor transport system permease protein